MERCRGMFGSMSIQFTRSLHYKEIAKNYPKVNVNDVVLDKPRYGYRKVRPPLISQGVKETLFPSTEIRKRYEEAGKPVPIKYRSRSDEISRRNFEKLQEEIAMGEPHFRVGEKKVYFPKARVVLLRPNAKHSPYQAKFLVPRNFNKMDLRDYLWNIYGLRALNVTVQLLHAKFTRGGDEYARYRASQYKKMTIDMLEPFVWPEISPELLESTKYESKNERDVIMQKNQIRSDKLKPIEAFDGLYKTPVLPNSFVPSKLRKSGQKIVDQYNKQLDLQSDKDLVMNYLNLNQK